MSVDSFKTNLPTVAVIVPTHRRPQLLKRAVESVLKQDYPLITQIIITQDGDDPETAMVAEEFARLDKRVLHVRNEKHKRGPCGNKNNGLDFVRADYVMLLDDDDYLIEANSVSLLAGFTENFQLVMGNCVGSMSGLKTGLSYDTSEEVTYEDLLCGRYDGEYAMLFSRDLAKNGFPEDLYGFEHLTWWRSMRELGSAAYYVDVVVKVYNEEGPRVSTAQAQKRLLMLEGYLRAIRDFGDDMNRLCPAALLKQLMMAIYFAKKAGLTRTACLLPIKTWLRFRRPVYLLTIGEALTPAALLDVTLQVVRKLRSRRKRSSEVCASKDRSFLA